MEREWRKANWKEWKQRVREAKREIRNYITVTVNCNITVHSGKGFGKSGLCFI